MTAPPPLTGLKVLELGGLAPGPFCGLLLSSYGASVLRIDRPSPTASSDLLTSSKASIALDLKHPPSVSLLLSLISTADILIDPFRPGILEKLNLDPQTVLLKRNPKLIVVRLTGFRRDGKYKDMAGHDINYLAVSGVLGLLGKRKEPPLHPVNILADFAGGGMVAFVGVLLALLQRGVDGRGQVVEANMVDGVSYLATFPRLGIKTDLLGGERGSNVLDGGAPYYGVYETRDGGRWMSVGALEPQFFEALLKGLELRVQDVCPGGLDRNDKRSWPYMREVFEKRFKEKTRTEWEKVFDGTDACCAPVLELGEMERQGYEQRPAVGLTRSPGRRIESAWVGKQLKPGEGGEERFQEWVGWKKGKDFDIQNGVWVIKDKARL